MVQSTITSKLSQMKPRTAKEHDAPFVLDIDTKSFDYYWTVDQWSAIWQARGMCILVIGEPPVGFCVINEDEVNGVKAMHIPKLAVREMSRGGGLGRRLLASVYTVCQKERIELMAASVPVFNVAGCTWMKKMGFDAVGMRTETINGRDEDVWLFTRGVECSSLHKRL